GKSSALNGWMENWFLKGIQLLFSSLLPNIEELEGLSCDNQSALEFSTLEVAPRLLGGNSLARAWNVRGPTPKVGFCAQTKIQYNRRFLNVVPTLSKEGPNANSSNYFPPSLSAVSHQSNIDMTIHTCERWTWTRFCHLELHLELG
uniref:Uncharacterized protein n=1 Tax=Oncorhynchus tshawytscha TaxID=74940 RepID=A0A8C8HRX3_ONCTS